MSNLRNIILFASITFLFTSFSYQLGKFKPEYKLLLYATLNDSTELQKSDTSWLNSKNCLQLKIDSIDMRKVTWFKNKEQRFYYNSQIFYSTQLFDVKMYNALKKVSITGFSVTVAALSEPRSVFASSTCPD